MATQHFIPELWASSILTEFHKNTVVTALANREYEGDLSQGKKLHIPGAVDVKIKDYKANNRTTTADEIDDTERLLEVTEEKNFDFYVDDIDRAQSKYGFEPYTASAARGLAEDAEQFLTDKLVSGTAVSSPNVTNWKTAYNAILKLRTALGDNHVPMSNRYLIVNSAFETALLGDDSKLTAVDTSGTSDGLREAIIGRLLQFTVLSSPFLMEAKPQAVAFERSSLAFVSQVNSIEGMRADNKFADRIRGLHVYGGGILRPEGVRVFTNGGGSTP